MPLLFFLASFAVSIFFYFADVDHYGCTECNDTFRIGSTADKHCKTAHEKASVCLINKDSAKALRKKYVSSIQPEVNAKQAYTRSKR